MYIYEQKEFPNFTYNKEFLFDIIAEVNSMHSMLLGRMSSIGFELKQSATLENLSQEVLKSSKIEGENLKLNEVRSSVARKLNINLEQNTSSSLMVDGIVNINIDAIKNYQKALSLDRLFAWHSNLFPTGFNDMYRIEVAQFRSDKTGKMQVVSLKQNRQIIHYEAPSSKDLPAMMAVFLDFINNTKHDIISVAIAHLWFLTMHPFEDGNGRIARAITEMLMSKIENSPFRFYSISNQIQKDRKNYYNILESTQKGNLDITKWIEYFLNTLKKALEDSIELSKRSLKKATFWDNAKDLEITATQRKVLNKILDGFSGNMTSRRWANICTYSQDTATREINNLISKSILKKEGVGRSTKYIINEEFTTEREL